MRNDEQDVLKSNLRQELFKNEQIIIETLLKGSDVEIRNDRGKMKVIESKKKVVG